MKIWLFIKSVNLSFASLASLVISLFFIIFSLLLIWRNAGSFPLAIPLWFSKPWGEERLAEPIFLWILPAASFSVVVINHLLSRYFQEREKVLYFLLLWAAPVASGLFFYTLLQIIFITT